MFLHVLTLLCRWFSRVRCHRLDDKLRYLLFRVSAAILLVAAQVYTGMTADTVQLSRLSGSAEPEVDWER